VEVVMYEMYYYRKTNLQFYVAIQDSRDLLSCDYLVC